MKTIKSNAEISNLFGSGRRVSTPYVNLIVSRHEEQHDHNGRVAFVAGKKLGNAVWRNKAKRRMRAICHELEGPFDDYDVIFVARKRVNDASFSEMKDRIGSALVKSGIIVKYE